MVEKERSLIYSCAMVVSATTLTKLCSQREAFSECDRHILIALHKSITDRPTRMQMHFNMECADLFLSSFISAKPVSFSSECIARDKCDGKTQILYNRPNVGSLNFHDDGTSVYKHTRYFLIITPYRSDIVLQCIPVRMCK